MAAAAAAYLQLRGLLAEVGEGVAQGLLCLHHVVEVADEGGGQPQDLLVLHLGLPEHLDLRLQLQVHGPGAPAKPLRQHLLGALTGHANMGSYVWMESCT